MDVPHTESTKPETGVSPVDERVAVIGAGVMGRSIALANLRRGFPVALTDSSPSALSVAAEWIESQLRCAVLPSPPCVRIVERIDDLGEVSVVVEAVVENLAVKRRLFEAASRRTPGSALLATNTSSLSISTLASAVHQPERFCGLHFCHPVARRRLVEVTAAPQTAPETIRRANAYVAALGKQPLMTADVPGFAVNRLLFPYLEAAVDLARRGVPFPEIESAAVRFGMPLGPLAQLDDIGIDVILRAAAGMHRGQYGIPATSEPLLALYQAGRLGRKSGAGFFRYSDGDADPRSDPEAAAIIGVTATASVGLSNDELILHLFLPMLAAAADLLERPVVQSVGEIRAALIDGLGFDPTGSDLLDWGATLPRSVRTDWLERLSLAGRQKCVENLVLKHNNGR
jgi:3-hydroxyacyl-CoA dehydrogenase